MGQIGNGNGRGYLAHHSLAVDAETGEVLGLTNQILHSRVKASKTEKAAERRARASRESRLWIRGTAGLPDDQRIIDVCDSGADNFEFLEHEVHRSEEHTSELQSPCNLVCRLLLEKKNTRRRDAARGAPAAPTHSDCARRDPVARSQDRLRRGPSLLDRPAATNAERGVPYLPCRRR